MIFSKTVMRNPAGLTNGAVQLLELSVRGQFLPDKANHFLAQPVASARPSFRALQMFDAGVQSAEAQAIGADAEQGADSFFQLIEKGEFVTRPCLLRDLEQGNGNRGWRWREVRYDFFVPDHLQHITDSLRQLAERDDWLVVSQPQIESDAFRHMIGQPPAR